MAWQRERYSQAVRKVRTVQEAAPATSNPCSRLPEQEAVRQVDELLLKFGITKIRAKFDAFLWRHQMKSPKKGMDPEEKGRVQRTQMQQSRPFMKPMSDFYKLQHSIL